MFCITSFGTVLLGAVVRLLLVSVVTPPFALSIFLFYFYYRIARYYLRSSREIKRLESVSNSPIYALFGEALNGVSSIRAYGAEGQFVKMIVSRVDRNHRAFFYLFATNRWLTFRTSFLSSVLVFIAGASILSSNLSAGWAGLAFNFANEVTSMLNRSIMTHSSLEMAMNSVERIEEFAMLPQEDYEGSLEMPEVWPSDGAVRVEKLVIKYAQDLPNVLKNVSFNVRPREKLGICGRTGAGKSTLSMAFFRILPYTSGTIFIDDINISLLGVGELRSRLTIIPQDPVLFEGTLRSNLDPLSQHTDDEIWEALKLTHLLSSLPSVTLDAAILENAANYSQGQRQLLCLARALLKSSRFIFMDEATASVDAETDAKIQTTIRTSFQSSTILTVAHRYLNRLTLD